MKTGYFRFCPRCATRLVWRVEHVGDKKVQTCPQCDFAFYDNPVGATDAVIVRNGKVLLIRRAWPPRQGAYDFPGGFMDGLETPEHGVIRETREEVGLQFKLQRLIGIYVNREYVWKGRRWPAVVMSYLGTASGRPQLNDEAGSVAWMPLTKRIRMAFRYQEQTLRDLKKLLKIPSVS